MFISRLSRFSAQILNRTRKNQFSVTGKQSIEGPLVRYLYPATNLWFSSTTDKKDHEDHGRQNEKISVSFIEKDGTEMLIKAPVGMSLLEVAHENDIELEGACEGSCACSTCHLIVMDMRYYNELDDPTDEENDMLDLAFGLTKTSRLGCQVILNSKLDGIRVALPTATQNFAN